MVHEVEEFRGKGLWVDSRAAFAVHRHPAAGTGIAPAIVGASARWWPTPPPFRCPHEGLRLGMPRRDKVAPGIEHEYDRAMETPFLQRITIEPGKCGGKPCIRGLRFRVCDVLELLANGATIEEILADYPFLERDDILAAIAYAARQTNHVVVEVA
jgi:uncharacterized protein (DUF433 family)